MVEQSHLMENSGPITEKEVACMKLGRTWITIAVYIYIYIYISVDVKIYLKVVRGNILTLEAYGDRRRRSKKKRKKEKRDGGAEVVTLWQSSLKQV